MSLLVVAYPELSFEDRQWIQEIRKQHDSNYAIIEPHFTLVFPDTTVDQQELITHVEHVTQGLHGFAVILRCAMVVKDALSPKTHLFLVPDKGFSKLTKLHDALYRGPLASSLRLDVPFIPHMTVGDNEDAQVMKVAADTINEQSIVVRIDVLALDILRHEAGVVEKVHTVTLLPGVTR